MPTPARHILSKSTFVKGCQCEKALYLNRHHPQLKAEITAQQQAVFDRGTDVGLLAQQLFPDGVDASPANYFEYQQSVGLTRELIAAGQAVIYEAAFMHEGVLAAVDILVQHNGTWKAYEVKSNLEVKETHLLDAALQYHVITGSGLPLEDFSIVHLNREYVRQGELEIDKLFAVESVLGEVLDKQSYVMQQVPFLKSVLEQPDVPAKDIGPHCTTPYPCDFMHHCWKHIPSPSIFDIASLRDKRTFELYHGGIIRFEDITPDIPLNDNQRMQVTCHLEKREHIDREALQQFLAGLTYPMYFLDFETFNPGVPLYDGTRPYQQVPFQYSIHYKKTRDGELRHTEFLASPAGDPRLPFLETLLEKTHMPGTILTYNQSFEIGILNGLAAAFPQHAEALNERIARIRDLMTPFAQRFYYAPAMQGSFSIKAVLPALVPELSYDQLPINNGDDAKNAFEHMTVHPEANHAALRKNMLGYCKMDTVAMVRVMEALS